MYDFTFKAELNKHPDQDLLAATADFAWDPCIVHRCSNYKLLK